MNAAMDCFLCFKLCHHLLRSEAVFQWRGCVGVGVGVCVHALPSQPCVCMAVFWRATKRGDKTKQKKRNVYIHLFTTTHAQSCVGNLYATVVVTWKLDRLLVFHHRDRLPLPWFLPLPWALPLACFLLLLPCRLPFSLFLPLPLPPLLCGLFLPGVEVSPSDPPVLDLLFVLFALRAARELLRRAALYAWKSAATCRAPTSSWQCRRSSTHSRRTLAEVGSTSTARRRNLVRNKTHIAAVNTT